VLEPSGQFLFSIGNGWAGENDDWPFFRCRAE